MAWLIRQKPLLQWTVAPRLVPSRQDLHKRQLAYRFANPSKRVPFGGSVLKQGLHVPLELLPQGAYIEDAIHALPDFLTMGCFGVSARIKHLIEQLEPDVHQFVYVPTYLAGDSTPREYYIMVVGHAADNQIDNERTTIRRNSEGQIELPSVDGERGDIVINRSQTRDWHAWISADIFHCLTISDRLSQSFSDTNIPGIDQINIGGNDV